MKLNMDKVNCFTSHVVNQDMTAMCEDRDGFQKLMVMYKHGNPIWAHKDCILVEPEKPEKSGKKNLTKRRKRV